MKVGYGYWPTCREYRSSAFLAQVMIVEELMVRV